MNPFESLYEYEKWAIRILIITLLFFGFGITTHYIGFENPISELVFTYFLDSILNESTGDSGYNYASTPQATVSVSHCSWCLSQGFLESLG